MHRDSVSDDQWKAQFDEDIRRFDYANKLGEFATTGGGGGGDDYGGGSAYDAVEKKVQAAKAAESTYGAGTSAGMSTLLNAVQNGQVTTEQARQILKDNLSWSK